MLLVLAAYSPGPDSSRVVAQTPSAIVEVISMAYRSARKRAATRAPAPFDVATSTSRHCFDELAAARAHRS
jgi:hypothetical protein